MADGDDARRTVLKEARHRPMASRSPLVVRMAEWPVSKGWRVVGAPQPSATVQDRDD